MRFLIVDDSPVIRLVLHRLLKDHGECDLVQDGEAALEAHSLGLSEGLPYNLICLDIGLPTISGMEVLTRIRASEAQRARGERTRVLIITASSEIADVEGVSERGADGYLVKPVNPDKLNAYLNKFGLLEAVQDVESGQCLQEVEAMCDADKVPVAVMAKLIRCMANSICRQTPGNPLAAD